MTYLAHIDGERGQTAQAHCRNAAEYAAAALRPVQLACLDVLAGLLHDMGKFKEAFRLYLQLAAAGDPAAVRGSVNHTFAAVRFLLQRYHKQNGDPIRNLTAELLACAVGAHHGLFDCIDDRRRKNTQFPALCTGARKDLEQIPHHFYIAPAEYSGAERTGHPQICR